MVLSPDNKINEGVLDLARNISYGDIKGTFNIVTATVSVLKDIVSNTEWNTARELMDVIIFNGKHLIEATPLEESIGNMVRRILQIIREEYSELKKVTASELKCKTDEAVPQESLHKILTFEGVEDTDFNISIPSLKSALIQHINEFEAELETCTENIVDQASENLHNNEIILTIGRSNLVEQYLKKAAETRSIEVIVAEAAPFLNGHETASSLAKAQIKTTLISDAAIFAMMSRVNKVIIGTHTVMANGGLKAISGSHIVAQAAKHFSVPVWVLLPLYKLSPLYLCSYEQNAFNKHVSPLQGVISGNNTALLEKCQSHNPVFDYVPPNLVTLFISNNGGNAPSYIYRFISELYHPDDYEL
ncbi:translation initiation factor eIF-2B subunit beta [Copidosoma floridanum]|uniref:translation initiation factor eIF-2B subunit beta n=1 Tax=Copidosoma floridanum TaxID=29053 RepID=UPI0006C9BFB2|nr:translation initiation factor eIF-2B subunit beta [Copidosoma floridanum]